jgi:signal transduction histidine kinase
MVGPERGASPGTSPGSTIPGAAYPAYPLPDAPPRPAGTPLTQRLQRRHWIAIDFVVAAFVVVCDLLTVLSGHAPNHVTRPLALLMAAVVFCSVGFRRRAPGTAFGALLILGILLAGMAQSASALMFVTASYVLYVVTVTSSKRTGATALALVLAAILGIVLGASPARQPDPEPGNVFVPVALANVIAWIAGYSVRQRRLYIVSLQHQAASSAVAEERLRIARELHDVVAHSMSVIAVQAGYGQYVIEVSPDGARDALGAIQATSRDALDEMRRMLGVLRQQSDAAGNAMPMPGGAGPGGLVPGDRGHRVPGAWPAATMGGGAAGLDPAARDDRSPGDGTRGDAAPLAPAPGLADLERLIQRTGGAGIRVSLTVSGPWRPVPAGVDLSAYRIIQEALTNVVKHAGIGAACTVDVYYEENVLIVLVTDNGAGRRAEYAGTVASSGPGHGLIGMRERAHLCGGKFTAGPLPDGGFQVSATLPVPGAAGVRGPVPAETTTSPGARPDETATLADDAAGSGEWTVITGFAGGQR